MSFAAVSLHPPNAPIPLYQASQYEGAGVIERKPNRPTSWDDRLKSVSAMVRARGDTRPPSRPVAIHGGATYPPPPGRENDNNGAARLAPHRYGVRRVTEPFEPR